MPGTYATSRRTPGRRRAMLAMLVLLAPAAAACGGSTESAAPAAAGSAAPVEVGAVTLRPGQPVPVPAGRPVLTVTGKVSARNKGASVLLDLAALERMGLVRARLYDPWAKRQIEVRGIELADLLAVAGAGADATAVRITALDDYHVDLTMTEVRAGGILLATGTGDGRGIEVADGGPTRIVFLDGVPAGANADQWIWSLKTIEVR